MTFPPQSKPHWRIAVRNHQLLSLLLVVLASRSAHAASGNQSMPAFHDHDVILFQGDSITDGGRCHCNDPNHIFGQSYAYLIAARVGAMLPDRHLTFINRGISGNTVADLAARWDKDTLALKPTVLSILIGVNDIGHGVSVEQYEQRYDKLLAETVKALPHIRLILADPFGLPVGHVKDHWEQRRSELAKFALVVSRLAAKYHATVVHYQAMFDNACKRAPADYWIWDGVHPRATGHELMADQWLNTFNTTADHPAAGD